MNRTTGLTCVFTKICIDYTSQGYKSAVQAEADELKRRVQDEKAVLERIGEPVHMETLIKDVQPLFTRVQQRRKRLAALKEDRAGTINFLKGKLKPRGGS